MKRPAPLEVDDLVFLALLLVVILGAGCAPVDVAVRLAREQAVSFAADAVDEGQELHPQARITAADAFDGFDAQHYVLTGEHLPSEVVAQVADARAEAQLELAWRAHGVAPVVSR